MVPHIRHPNDRPIAYYKLQYIAFLWCHLMDAHTLIPTEPVRLWKVKVTIATDSHIYKP
jgi:hypothetical protein